MAKLSVLFILIFIMTSVKISRATGVSCDFEHDGCGWSNDNNMTLHWTRDSCTFSFLFFCNKGNMYMNLAMDEAEVDTTGRLSSPWLNGSVHHRCHLQFRYYIENGDTCQLSVFLRTETNFTSLWRTTIANSWFRFRDSPSITVPCTERQYQLVFEGKKVRQSSRNILDDEIDIDDVEFEQSIISSPPTTSTTTTSFTTTTKQQQSTQHRATDASSPNHQTALQTATSQSSPVHSDNPATTVGTVLSPTPSGGHPAALSNTDNDTGLATGALVAIIVTVIVAVVVVVIVVFLLRRRKETGQKTDCQMPWFFKRNLTAKPASTDKTTVSRAVDNCGYAPDEEHSPAYENADGTATSTKRRHPGSVHLYSTPDDSGYELASLPHNHGTPRQVGTRQDSNNLSSPRDVKPMSSPRDVKPVSSTPLPGHSYENETTQQGSEPDENAVPHADRKSKPLGAAEGKPVYETTAEEHSHAPAPVYSAQGRRHGENYYFLLEDQDNEYSYSLAQGEDHEYSSAQGEHHEYSLGQEGQDKYCLAHNVTAPTSAETAPIYAMSGTTNYEIVDDDGGRLATSSSAPSGDVYNRLNAKGGPVVGQKVHQNHYDHISDPAGSGAEYSSLGQEERTRDLQREIAEGDYSHI